METSPLESCYADDPRVIALLDAIASEYEWEDHDGESVEVPGPPYRYMQASFVVSIQEILQKEGWTQQGHHGNAQWTYVKTLEGSEDLECRIHGAEDIEERFTLEFFLVDTDG
jgi:hypothetical protein